MTEDTVTNEPSRARALFSTADFRLLRAALTSHARQTEDREELARISALHHRLGTYAPSESFPISSPGEEKRPSERPQALRRPSIISG